MATSSPTPGPDAESQRPESVRSPEEAPVSWRRVMVACAISCAVGCAGCGSQVPAPGSAYGPATPGGRHRATGRGAVGDCSAEQDVGRHSAVAGAVARTRDTAGGRQALGCQPGSRPGRGVALRAGPGDAYVRLVLPAGHRSADRQAAARKVLSGGWARAGVGTPVGVWVFWPWRRCPAG